MHRTKLQQLRETERARAFHKRVTIGIVSGFALLIATATILVMSIG